MVYNEYKKQPSTQIIPIKQAYQVSKPVIKSPTEIHKIALKNIIEKYNKMLWLV